MTRTVEIVTTPVDGVEITWSLEYSWSKPVPATYLDPPEGGAEIEGEPEPIAVTYYPEQGEPFSIDNIQPGSILNHLLGKKYKAPHDGECWDAINEDLGNEDDADDAARESAYEARLEARLMGD